jgi:hypothetical protein
MKLENDRKRREVHDQMSDVMQNTKSPTNKTVIIINHFHANYKRQLKSCSLDYTPHLLNIIGNEGMNEQAYQSLTFSWLLAMVMAAAVVKLLITGCDIKSTTKPKIKTDIIIVQETAPK